MKIVALMMVHNELDILEPAIRHLFDHGVAGMLACDHRSTDGSRERLDALAREFQGRMEVWRDEGRVFQQMRITNDLAQAARAFGADWLLPVDADEFWIPLRHATLAEAFADAETAGADTVRARVFQHLDWTRRLQHPQELPKLAMRARPRARARVPLDALFEKTMRPRQFLTGNHQTEPNGTAVMEYLVEVREISYRGPDHYVRKTRERIETLRPDGPTGENVHYKQRIGLSDAQLVAQWRERDAGPSVVSPIPSRFRVLDAFGSPAHRRPRKSQPTICDSHQCAKR